MTISMNELTTRAMSLSGEARALLAEKLIESLDRELVCDVWLTEAKRRRDEVRSGHVKPIPGIKAMESVRKIIRNVDEITSPTMHHSFRPPLSDLKSQKY